jgi:hypothetical protein
MRRGIGSSALIDINLRWFTDSGEQGKVAGPCLPCPQDTAGQAIAGRRKGSGHS